MPYSEFSPQKVEWGSTQITKDHTGKTNMRLHQRNIPFTLPLQGIASQGGVPDLSFILDSSGSMERDREYHLAVLAYYGIMKYLEEEGIAPLINYNLMNFSSRTIESGWQSYDEIDEIKKALFSYQGKGTRVDAKAIKRLSMDRRNNFISFMLSDGDLNEEENCEEVVSAIRNMTASGGAGFYLYQMGERNEFTSRIEKMGHAVQYIRSPDDFMRLSIQFTKDLYGKTVKE